MNRNNKFANQDLINKILNAINQPYTRDYSI